MVAVLMMSGSTVAHAATPVPAWAAECAERDNDAARLACYDSQNPPRKKAAKTQSSATPPAPAQTAAPRASAPPAAPPDDFGLSESRKRESAPPPPAEPAELVASVASVSQRLTGELLLKLDNGQSWVQAQRNSAVRIKAGERVSIARGAFGGYLLHSDSGASMRVRRLE